MSDKRSYIFQYIVLGDTKVYTLVWYQFNDARNNQKMNSGRYQFVMIIPDQIFLSFIISFSSTSRDEQKQTQFVSQVCGWEKIIKHEICSYQFSNGIQF